MADGIFDWKHFNNNVYQKYTEKIPDLKLNTMLKAGVLKVNNKLKTRLKDGVGGNRISEPIKGLIDGDYVNYDGNTDITVSSRDTFLQTKIVKGWAKGWEEKDFSTDISGENYMALASETETYHQGVKMDLLLSVLKGIFSIPETNDAVGFVSKHTYEENAPINATSINNACQKGFGDRKDTVSLAFMHSSVSTTLENLQLLEYLKYTDSQGIQSNMKIAQQGNKLVIIDDDMPVQNGYFTATADTPNALKVITTGTPTANEILKTTVDAAAFHPTVAANDYVVAGSKYTTYLLGKEAIEYCDIGAKVPVEPDRDPKTDGGKDILYTRKRILYAPKYISWVGAETIISPTAEQYEAGANWKIVNNGQTGNNLKWINPKIIPIARLITRG